MTAFFGSRFWHSFLAKKRSRVPEAFAPEACATPDAEAFAKGAFAPEAPDAIALPPGVLGRFNGGADAGSDIAPEGPTGIPTGSFSDLSKCADDFTRITPTA